MLEKMRIDNFAAPTLMIGSIPVYGDLILAPMDGITDLPLRAMLREMGSAMSYTGFINAISVVNHDVRTEPILAYEEKERPVVFQLFDDSPERMLQAALMLRERNPDIIDVNMGCSAKTVAGRGAGAGLLVEPHKIERIFKLLTHNLDIPITGKIRLGWDDESRNLLAGGENHRREWGPTLGRAWAYQEAGIYRNGRLGSNCRDQSSAVDPCDRQWGCNVCSRYPGHPEPNGLRRCHDRPWGA